MKYPPGFIPERITDSDAIYDVVFGSLGQATPISWKQYLPKLENQVPLPYCVSFSRLNCAEAVAKKNGQDINFSDRALAVESGTTKEGASFTEVSEKFRVLGAVSEADCPFVDSWDESVKLPDLSGKRRYFGGSHSWVVGGVEAMRDALKYSPLQVGYGVGLEYNFGGVVPPPSGDIKFYHGTVCYEISDKGFEIYDSIYAEFKTLSLEYPIPWAKSFRDLPAGWKKTNSMYLLQRDPENVNEIFAVRSGVIKRHIANRQTLVLGAIEPDALCSFYPGSDIPLGCVSFKNLVEGAELILAPKD